MQYRFPHFKRELMLEDLRFHSGPQPGQPMPDFELTTTDGRQIKKSDFVGLKPLLLTFGSVT